MVKSRVILVFVSLVTSFGLIAQGLPYFSSYTFSDPQASLFQISGPQSQTSASSLAVPYRSPAELLFGNPSFREEKSFDPLSSAQVFSPVIPFTSSLPYRQPENLFDPYSRAYSNLMSSRSAVTTISFRKGFSLDVGVSLGMSLNQGAVSYVDVSEARARLKFRVNRNLFSYLRNAKLELFLQLSEIQRFDSAALGQAFNGTIRSQDPARTNFIGRQVYVSPGISLSNSNLIFEGVVRVPINTREANRTLDELWAPEIQGNLGLKYLLPVTQSKN